MYIDKFTVDDDPNLDEISEETSNRILAQVFSTKKIYVEFVYMKHQVRTFCT